MLKSISYFLLILSMSLGAFGQKDTIEINKSIGSQKVRLLFTTRPFVKKRHRIRQISDEKRGIYGTWIDGKLALGTDLSIPKTEIVSIMIYLNGKELPAIRPELYSDCYEPNFDKENFWLKLGDDEKSIMALMAGGDAAGSYQVFWIFRSDGGHSRFSNHVSDGNIFDFANWFFDK